MFELVPKSPQDFRRQQNNLFKKKVYVRMCNNNNNKSRGIYVEEFILEEVLQV